MLISKTTLIAAVANAAECTPLNYPDKKLLEQLVEILINLPDGPPTRYLEEAIQEELDLQERDAVRGHKGDLDELAKGIDK